MMSTFTNVHIVFFILFALNAASCYNLAEPSENAEDNVEEMIDKDDKNFDKKAGHEKETKRLETALTKSWQELDKMLFCTKLPVCVIRYSKKYRVGKKNVRMNLIQSITLTMHQIKDITSKLKALKR